MKSSIARGCVKICGLRSAGDALAAARAGAGLLGFVLVPGALRRIEPDAFDVVVADLKRGLGELERAPPALVALLVDPDDALVDLVARYVDFLQLHGAETPARVAAIRERAGVKVAKAVGVAGAEDAIAAAAYDGFADLLVFDAKPSGTGPERGGQGVGYDREALLYYGGGAPFLVAGGLAAENVEAAVTAVIRHPGFIGVDVSSGVERARGVKDHAMFAEFIAAARVAIERKA